MTDHDWDEPTKAHMKKAYNPPLDVPREAMWEEIASRLPGPSTTSESEDQNDVLSLAQHREGRVGLASGAPSHWRRNTLLAAAAGVVLWLGFGLGRVTQPGVGPEPAGTELAQAPPEAGTPAPASAGQGAAQFATTRHLQATRSLLTAVGSEAEAGAIDPNVASLATMLLTQTRLMLDSSAGRDVEVVRLLEDLELILVQVVHASKAGASGDSEVGRMELQQLTQGLEDNEVLPRIQELLPPVMAGAAD